MVKIQFLVTYKLNIQHKPFKISSNDLEIAKEIATISDF